MLLRALLPGLCCVGLAVGCAPEIGDKCETPLDCSSQASRECDRTQPSGYCTIRGCEPGTCPDESVCIKFHPGQAQPSASGMISQPERLATTYCMAKCSSNGDCRDDDGYHCTSAADFGPMEAENLDSDKQRFCAAIREEPIEESTAPPPPVEEEPQAADSDADSGASQDAP